MERLNKQINGGAWRHTWQAGRRAIGVRRVQVLLFESDLEKLAQFGENVSEYARLAVRARIKDTHETAQQ